MANESCDSFGYCRYSRLYWEHPNWKAQAIDGDWHGFAVGRRPGIPAPLPVNYLLRRVHGFRGETSGTSGRGDLEKPTNRKTNRKNMEENMTDKGSENIANLERRRFLGAATKYGLTTAVAATAAGTLISDSALAQTAQEEAERKKAAKYTMTIGTAYIVGASRMQPIMQLDFKENIQNMSNGEIYVNLAAGKKLGAGKVLANKVQKGIIQVAQHSISNLAPFAPAADLINLPYWSATNQQFVNLVTSDMWAKTVHPKVEAGGFKILWYPSFSPRTFSVRKGGKPVLSPADMAGLKFRVPGSKMLQQFVRLLGANPTPVAWGETPSAIKQGVADALDVTVNGLAIFGFADILDHVTLGQTVHGGQVYSCNLEWFNALPKNLQDSVMYASDVTFRQNLAKVPAAFAYAQTVLRAGGVKFHTLSDDAMKEFKELGGHQRSEWDGFKKELAGSLDTFDKLLTAANTLNNRYVVDNV